MPKTISLSMLLPSFLLSDIMPSFEAVTQTKNGGILKMPVSVTIELVKRASEKMADVLEVGRGPLHIRFDPFELQLF